MSDKLMNFLSRKENESHFKNYYFDDEEDELNLQIYYDEKKIDDNVFNKKNENKYFMEKLDDNINETGRETTLYFNIISLSFFDFTNNLYFLNFIGN